MLLALLAVAALAWWLHREGLLLPNLVRLGGSAAAGLLALRLLTTGRPLAAMLAAGAAWAWWRWSARPASSGDPERAAAARLLGVASNAPPEAVWQAWRQAMARAHPDAGGSAAEVQALTEARDRLIAAHQADATRRSVDRS